MALFSKWFGKKKASKSSVSTLIPLPPGSFLEAVFTAGRLSTHQAFQLYRQNSTLNTAVEKTAEKIEQITPIVKDENDKIIPNHPVQKFLKTPNAFELWRNFIGMFSRDFLVVNNAFFSMLGLTSRFPLEMYNVNPQNVSITQAPDYYPHSYNVSISPASGYYERVEENRRMRFLDGNLREIYHLKGYTSRSDFTRGDSLIEAALLETKQQIKGRVHNLSVLENGGRLSLLVNFKEEEAPTDDEHKERIRRINEDLSGTHNAGKIAVISGLDVSITEAGTSNKDMDFAKLDEMASRVIYLRYGVPLPLVTTEASTYNNFETALLDFYENTVLPKTDIFFEALTQALVQRGDFEGLRLSYDPASINILIRQMLEQVKKRKDIGIETINELRALIPGREPIDSGGDILYQPSNVQPVGVDLFTGDNYDPGELERELRREREVAVGGNDEE